MARPRQCAGQLIGQAAPAAKSARAREPATGSIPADVAFQIMLCGRRGAVHRRPPHAPIRHYSQAPKSF
jgi:hypothetical protein|eukprot:COSAG01_NODE_613_length_14831_cov_8.108675_17_plen_69_part_00